MKQDTKVNGPNIILITIDALRYDHLGCYGYHRNTSPNIDALASRGVKFTQAISNGGQTPQSFPAILASALPSLSRPKGKAILGKDIMLAELLREADYHTAAFHSNPYLSKFYGYNRGFDVFDDKLSGFSLRGARLRLRAQNAPDTLVGRIRGRVGKIIRPTMMKITDRPIVTANETTNKATSWLKVNKGKFFIWLHYMDVHNPYLPASKYVRYFYEKTIGQKEMVALNRKMINKADKMSPFEIETIISLYDAEVRYVDEAVGMLLDKLENYQDNTLVIISADHGDEFGEHGKFGHHTLYEGILRVPLIIAGPDIKEGKVVKQQVSLIDLAPTIVELLGIKSPVTFHGKGLLPIIRGEKEIEIETISTYVDPFVERRSIACRTPGWKYICNEILDSGLELGEEIYDLRKDPREINNMHGGINHEANAFELEAKRKIAKFKQSKIEEATGYEGKEISAKIGILKKSGKI